MTSLMVGIYGLYLIALGVKGNSSKLIGLVDQDAKGFVPWLLIVIVLGSAYEVPALQKPVEAFTVLLVLGMIVSQHSKIVPAFENFYADLTGTTLGGQATAMTSSGQQMTGSN